MPERDTFEVVVSDVVNQTAFIKSFELRSPSGTSLPTFEAGAHIAVSLPSGLKRQYSIVNDPQDRSHYLLGIKLEQNGQGASKEIHREFVPGRRVLISSPRSRFSLLSGPRRSLLLSAGIGVTPLLSMAATLRRNQTAFFLHHFARSVEDIAFKNLLLGPALGKHVHLHYNLMPPALDGVIDDILTTEAPDAVYVCGPQPFIDLAENRSDAFGLPKGQLVKELFSAAPPQIETSDASFAIELAGSGLRLDVPCTMSILEVLRQNGITVPTSCEQGVCGTCLTKVRHGTPDHRDLYLSDDERANGDLIALCVSRAKSAKLVLDI